MKSIRITGIVASPRKNKNSDTLVQKVLDGCQNQGALVDKINLKDLEISPCKAHKTQDCVLPVFDIWSNEVNLDIIDNLCVSEGQLGLLPMESEKILKTAFQLGKNLAKQLIGTDNFR